MTIHLDARLLPMDRGELLEDPLEAHLSERSFRAELGDAGTRLSAEGEPTSCDVQLEVAREDVDLQVLADSIAEFLDSRSAPRAAR